MPIFFPRFFHVALKRSLWLTPCRYLIAHFCVFLLVPPALTTVTLSQSLGGFLYPTAALSTVFSVVMPLGMIVVASTFDDATEFLAVGDMPFFFVILAVGYVVPIGLAQLWGRLRPIQSKKHVQHWMVVASAAYVAMAFLVGLAFTPTTFLFDLSTVIFFDVVNTSTIEMYSGAGNVTVSNDFVSTAFLLPLLLALATNVAVQVLGVVSRWAASRCDRRRVNEMAQLDV